MKLWTSGAHGVEQPLVTDGNDTFDARDITASYDPEFFAQGGLDQLRGALERGELKKVDVDPNARIGAPIKRPHAVICIGQNYAAHAAESGSAPPKEPIIFFKHPNTLAGPHDDVVIPRKSAKTDWEVELGVVLNRSVSYLGSVDEAEDAIAGFVLANDLSERAFQLELSGGQWSKGKVAPGFAPLGPYLVTRDEVDAGALGIRSWVNGEVRQDSNTQDMIFNVGTLIHHLSQFMTLDAGDVILTGTPEGVALSGRFPYLKEGDVVELEIDGLGKQKQTMRKA